MSGQPENYILVPIKDVVTSLRARAQGRYRGAWKKIKQHDAFFLPGIEVVAEYDNRGELHKYLKLPFNPDKPPRYE